NSKIVSASVERKVHTMKSRKKVALIAVAATLVMAITVYAASGIISTWFSSSSSIPDYKTLPSAEQVAKDIGYEAVTIDEFANGYKFYSGSIKNNALADENGNVAEKFKSVTFRYEKDGDEVIFSQDKFNSTVEQNGKVITTVDGIDVYYYSYTNKLVPGNYKMTVEDRKAEESGELVFSYGMDEVEIVEVQAMSWEKDSTRYQLMQIDGKLSADELAEMAKEIIEK
ncbi:MAG: hypothetical protein IJ300_02790, partial [Clostridia bacterium]|nr:hypothetical protein [Clostridia bacterium]